MKIVITGAASGIGRATARLFATKPHDGQPAVLMLVDRDAASLADAAVEIAPLAGRVETIVADLAREEVPGSVVSASLAAFGGIDALISNAGVLHTFPLAELPLSEYERIFAINTRATFLMAQAAYPALRKSRGAIVATASMAAEHPATPLGAYSASKAALRMLIRQMALEWGPDGIRCNSVSPGPTETGMTGHVYRNEELRQCRSQEIPLHRIGTPEDLAAAIHFLAGPGASFISGVDLTVDGGLNTTLMVSRNSAAAAM
ncbi:MULTISPECIES: SDR family oxidoreductase [unclassified Chelatococcus]|uniref:SDR family NAD(P)-dependent oxidoreductase n=1 Tax=unclassified Chelatococcus TaxID=2638111 RepID=UPI001BCFD729|nr:MULTISPECIES: SDR family oxidoreductase [unclassified Chelatococcus]MBS7743472.1 SDR family oxidoreductase [Chelatococcus sp. HY11]MBX3547088.1 SDR family oxidoreductase [Chelatococcus sp.]CAH1663558.1 SDR family oxidoreductase [Hyphomicrobiales bacterium]CAH1687737.1 SDR family oxidoreductase [Hyphomicrobiales bacterium]